MNTLKLLAGILRLNIPLVNTNPPVTPSAASLGVVLLCKTYGGLVLVTEQRATSRTIRARARDDPSQPFKS